MKKILVVVFIMMCVVRINAQNTDIKITDYGIYSVGAPHFEVIGDSMFMTFDTNFPYLEFPIGGPAVPYTINSVSKPPSTWGPVYAQLGVIGKFKSIAFIDYNSTGQYYSCYETHTEDNGANWSVLQLIDTVQHGNSISTNNLNPLYKHNGLNFYCVNQIFDSPRPGLLKVTKLDFPGFYATDFLFPLDTTKNYFPQPYDYEIAGSGSGTKHALAFFNEYDDKLFFVKSNNDGANFSDPEVIWKVDTSKYFFTNPLNLDMTIDASGKIIIAFTIFLEDANFNASDKLFLAISNDFGNTWKVDSVPGLSNWGVEHPRTGIRSNGHRVVSFLENGYLKTFTTNALSTFSAIDTISDLASVNNYEYHMIVKNDYIYAAWSDNRFGFGLEEIYYDTLYAHAAPFATTVTPNNQLEDGVQISPNPFSDRASLQIAGDNDERYQISIVDMFGRLVRTYTDIRSGNLEIKREDLSSGIYFIRIVDYKNNERSRRIVIN